MPFSVKIPVLNNSDCTSSLIVGYKKSTDTDWTSLPPQPVTDYIMINNLDDCTTYNIRTTKQCCNGQFSTEADINVTTGGNCATS